MKIRYEVKAVHHIGDEVKILLQKNSVVEEKELLNPFEMIDSEKGLDMGDMMQKMQNMTLKMTNQDSITVPYDEWQKDKIQVDDIIVVDAKKE